MDRGKIKITVEAPPNGFKSTMAEFLRKAMFDAFDAAVVDVIDDGEHSPWNTREAERAQARLSDLALNDGLEVEIVTKVSSKNVDASTSLMDEDDFIDDFQVGDEVIIINDPANAGVYGVVCNCFGYDHRRRMITVEISGTGKHVSPRHLRHRDFAVGDKVRFTTLNYGHVKDAVVVESAFPRRPGYGDGMVAVSWTGAANGGIRTYPSSLELDPESRS